MEKKIEKIAVLIDGDNAQAKLLKAILEEIAKYGKVTIRRIYGDWTQTNMNSWKDLLNDLSFTPIQKFSYTSGKNSTDGALIIDAMDILHSGVVDGFCIVSSDSDYTGLAKRIREEGVFVMGVGEKKTPNAFVRSCEVFTFSENIVQEEVLEKEATTATSTKNTDKAAEKQYPKVELDLIDKAYFMSNREDAETLVSALGTNLRKIDPSFDSRAHGFYNLTKLLESLPEYEVLKIEIGGVKHNATKRKQKTARK
ncbi:NYN domain-containing protein [Mucilaginibacter sp. OK098]|uniref:NYN domain-containing protein n=1 Tax=Mucilaginibacter sp. OK098 TaxID=1855297 RepID=UPI000923E058|nr:NYN domain-containing protein [Mucilaginibacter sp. OK098]SHM14133.1 Uncharacterized conserved protein, LabA/DUF88 family [Mucilaginibacter sp. OK098]